MKKDDLEKLSIQCGVPCALTEGSRKSISLSGLQEGKEETGVGGIFLFLSFCPLGGPYPIRVPVILVYLTINACAPQ